MGYLESVPCRLAVHFRMLPVPLRVFYEETEGENEGQTKSKVESCAHLFRMFPIYKVYKKEDEKVSYGFIELPWMAWMSVYIIEDKRPWNISYLTDDL